MDELPKANPSLQKKEDLNKRTRLLLQSIGWTVATTQWFNAYTGKSNDLFSFADLLAFIPPSPDVVLIQVTSKHNRSARLKKILSNRNAFDWSRSKHHLIWLSLWHRGPRNKWEHTIEQIFTKDFEDACLIDCYRDAESELAATELSLVPAIANNTPLNQSSTVAPLPIKRSTTHKPGKF